MSLFPTVTTISVVAAVAIFIITFCVIGRRPKRTKEEDEEDVMKLGERAVGLRYILFVCLKSYYLFSF